MPGLLEGQSRERMAATHSALIDHEVLVRKQRDIVHGLEADRPKQLRRLAVSGIGLEQIGCNAFGIGRAAGI